jgi:hypothetical protein
MSGQQKTVLWIGLILVGLNLVGRWKEIATVIFTGAGILGGIPTPGSSSSSGSNSPLNPLNLIPGHGGLFTTPTTKTKTTLM